MMLLCLFMNEEGVGDVVDLYVYDGKCVCKWSESYVVYG